MSSKVEISVACLSAYLEQENFSSVALITNKNSFFSSNISQKIFCELSNKKYLHYFDVSPNPTVEDLNKMLAFFKDFEADFVLGVGGGSAMDLAKMLAVFYQRPVDIYQEEFTRSLSLGLIPTTAGSGSEATQFAVVYNNGNKVSLDHPSLLPDLVILDPSMTESLPRYTWAYTTADALCQAIESYWAKAANSESQTYALEAIELIINNVSRNDEICRKNLLRASHLAGKAINITRTTAPHALSYFITQKYNIPHGHAVALTLPYILVENSKQCDLSAVMQILNVRSSIEAQHFLISFFQKLGLEMSFKNLGILDRTEIADQCNTERLTNNPYPFTKIELQNLLSKIP